LDFVGKHRETRPGDGPNASRVDVPDRPRTDAEHPTFVSPTPPSIAPRVHAHAHTRTRKIQTFPARRPLGWLVKGNMSRYYFV